VAVTGVTFSGVGKLYPDGTRALRALDLEIAAGEFMVLVGPSGCGKTTALRMVAGLEDITEGEIAIGDRVVNDLEPQERDVAMVFQSYALYPHMTVFENLAFGLETRRTPKAEVKRRVNEIVGVLGLNELVKRKPKQLSGGQRQRVAMGRAIVRDPSVFLMDEPLSNLDAKLRVQMRAEIARIQRELGVTTIYVTHDQVEAMTMGHRVAVMHKGELQQKGPPQEVYDDPVNLFVASFIGSPAMNLCTARLERDGDGLMCALREHRIPVPRIAVERLAALESYVGQDIGIGIRPEHLEDTEFAPHDGRPRLAGRVTLTEALGPEQLVHIDIAADPVVTREVLEVAQDVDDAIARDLESEAADRRVSFVGRFDPRSKVTIGQEIEIAVDHERIFFFDLSTGLAIGRG
jgi:multiple sugar transport system ATP-binding protein